MELLHVEAAPKTPAVALGRKFAMCEVVERRDANGNLDKGCCSAADAAAEVGWCAIHPEKLRELPSLLVGQGHSKQALC